MFLIIIIIIIIINNNLHNALSKSKAILYADDTTVYLSGKTINTLYNDMNKDLSMLAEWFLANKLAINVSKTNYMFFTKHKQVNLPNIELKINNEPITRTPTFRFLGIYLDGNLNWKDHTNACKLKMSKALYAIRSISDFLPMGILQMLYHTLVYPH